MKTYYVSMEMLKKQVSIINNIDAVNNQGFRLDNHKQKKTCFSYYILNFINLLSNGKAML